MNVPYLFSTVLPLNDLHQCEHTHVPAHAHTLHSRLKEATSPGDLQAIFWGRTNVVGEVNQQVRLLLTVHSWLPNPSLFLTGINGLWQKLNAVFSLQIEWFQVFSSGEHLQDCSLTLNFRLPGLSVEQRRGECSAVLLWHPQTSLPHGPRPPLFWRSTSECMENIASESCLDPIILWRHFCLILSGSHSSSAMSYVVWGKKSLHSNTRSLCEISHVGLGSNSILKYKPLTSFVNVKKKNTLQWITQRICSVTIIISQARKPLLSWIKNCVKYFMSLG